MVTAEQVWQWFQENIPESLIFFAKVLQDLQALSLARRVHQEAQGKSN